MPGIAGVIGPVGGNIGNIVTSMIGTMTHEADYVVGHYVNEELRLGVAWTVRAGSFADVMPLWNEARNVCLVFSGENFVRDEDLASIPGKVDPGNAKYLMSMYESQGVGFLEQLNGWFSGLIIDLRSKEAILFNDRFGLGRIYCHEGRDGFHFASEAKAILCVVPEARQLVPRAVAESFSCGAVLQNRTLFAGIELLPPASSWRFGRAARSRENYFSPVTWEQQSPLQEAAFYESLKSVFPRILPKYLKASSSVAMSLTGGLDGRMIMSWAHAAPDSLPTYTFNGPYRECTDLRLARRISALCGQPHSTITVGDDFLGQFPTLAERTAYISDGCMDMTGAVELYANRLAREIAPVRLTGNYGSEVVRGNVAFRPANSDDFLGLLAPDFASLAVAARETYRMERDTPTQSFVAFKQTPWHHYSRLSIEQSQLTVRSPYLDNELVALMFRAPSELLVSKEPSLRLIRDGNAAIASVPTDRGEVYGDVSFERRARAFLAELLVKSEYGYDYGMPQWLCPFDQLLAPLRPQRMFLGHQKFYHFRVWYRDQLASYLKEVLLDPTSRARLYLRRGAIEQIVDEHTSGARNWTRELHRVLALELTQRTLIERW